MMIMAKRVYFAHKHLYYVLVWSSSVVALCVFGREYCYVSHSIIIIIISIIIIINIDV